MLREIWKPVPDLLRYEVSNLGRVRTILGITIGNKTRQGYLSKCVTLKNGKRRQYLVHRLIMLAFVGPSNLDVNHKNGIKHDNRLTNLEYLTRTENNHHAYRTGLWKPNCGSKNGMSKLSEKNIGLILSSSERRSFLAKKFGVSERLIYRIRAGKAWKNAIATFREKVGK